MGPCLGDCLIYEEELLGAEVLVAFILVGGVIVAVPYVTTCALTLCAMTLAVGLADGATASGGAMSSGVALGAATALANKVPAYTGGRTYGTLVRADGTEERLVSGWHPPASAMPKGTPGMNIVTKSHVEAHAAAIMRNEGLSNATLWINRAPCPGDSGCQAMLPRMVPTGSTLRINVVPDGSTGELTQSILVPGRG